MRKRFVGLAFVVFTGLWGPRLCAQPGAEPFRPSREEMAARYRASAARDSLFRHAVPAVGHAHWPTNESFWYLRARPDGTVTCFSVDARMGAKRVLFESRDLLGKFSPAAAPAELTQSLTRSLQASENIRSFFFDFRHRSWQYDPASGELQAIDSLPRAKPDLPVAFSEPPSFWENYSTDSLSPDGQLTATLRGGNLALVRRSDSAVTELTRDGTEAHPFGSAAWSPNGRYLIVYRISPVADSPIRYVLSSVPGTTRGQLRSYAYKQPGDPFTTYEMFVVPAAHPRLVKVETPLIDFYEAPHLYWAADGDHFFYERIDRGHQRFRIVEVDARTGSTRTVVDEQTKTFVYDNRVYTHFLPATREIIYSSEKEGWRQLYLVNTASPVRERKITRGAYVVRDIDSIDEKRREIWFTASGVHPDEDVYNVHAYRIRFDGSGLRDLTPHEGHHEVSFSPDRRYYLDTYSDLRHTPVSALHSTENGRLLVSLESPGAEEFPAVSGNMPRRFVAKGRDGTTDIYGDVFFPTGFDSAKRYPIVENIYAGPQDSYVPVAFIGRRDAMQSLADLGFVVVQLDGMGTANRSKAFHDVCWHNLADAGFPDRIRWMKALSAAYPWADTSRVGVYGTSAGGQNALGALLFHPEWYKAAVASCGCHDNRVDKQWWNEQWMGYPVGPWYAEQSNVENAGKLRGALLLIVGEADNNVPPESTYRVADALIRAGKIFDFLPIPGSDHTSGGSYGDLKRKDFFVRNLLGAEPPNHNTSEVSEEKE